MKEIIRPSALFRTTDSWLTLQIPALPKPTIGEIQKDYPWAKSIVWDSSPTCPITLELGTVLRRGESSIDGLEYRERIFPVANWLLGYQHRKWLKACLAPASSFVAKYFEEGHIDFPGFCLRDEAGRENISCVGKNEARWHRRFGWVLLEKGIPLQLGDRIASTSSWVH